MSAYLITKMPVYYWLRKRPSASFEVYPRLEPYPVTTGALTIQYHCDKPHYKYHMTTREPRYIKIFVAYPRAQWWGHNFIMLDGYLWVGLSKVLCTGANVYCMWLLFRTVLISWADIYLKQNISSVLFTEMLCFHRFLKQFEEPNILTSWLVT